MILGVWLENPGEKNGEQLQKILTQYGCTIRTRIGLHNDDEDFSEGIIILEIAPESDNEEIINLKKSLLKLDNIKIREMDFNS